MRRRLVNVPSLPYQAQNGFWADALRADHPRRSLVPALRPVNYSHSGDTTVQMESKKTLAALNAITHYMGQGGINDVQTGVPLGPGAGSSIDNVTSIMNYMQGRGIGGWWIGLWCLRRALPRWRQPVPTLRSQHGKRRSRPLSTARPAFSTSPYARRGAQKNRSSTCQGRPAFRPGFCVCRRRAALRHPLQSDGQPSDHARHPRRDGRHLMELLQQIPLERLLLVLFVAALTFTRSSRRRACRCAIEALARTLLEERVTALEASGKRG